MKKKIRLVLLTLGVFIIGASAAMAQAVPEEVWESYTVTPSYVGDYIENQLDPEPPVIPQNFRTTSLVFNQVDLAWNNPPRASWIELQKRLTGENFETIIVAEVPKENFSDQQIEEGLIYQYRIRAANAGGESDWSTIEVAIPKGPPLSPSNLTASAISPLQVDLTWVDNSDNETGFKIERSLLAESGFSQITTLSADSVSYSDTGLNPDTTYYYRISAYNETADSEYSDTAFVTTPALAELRGSLSGRVTEKKGRKTKPIANALVSIADKTTKTNRKGNYTIPDIPIGTHQVGVTKSGYKPSSRQVTIEQDKTIKGDFRLTKTKAGHIQGRVYEGKGKRRRPLSGAKVTIGSQTSITNANGYYSIRYVTAGKKTIKITKEGYKSESKRIRIRRNRTKRQNFYLKKK